MDYNGPNELKSCLELMVPARLAHRREKALQALVDAFDYDKNGTPYITRPHPARRGSTMRIPLHNLTLLILAAKAALADEEDPDGNGNT